MKAILEFNLPEDKEEHRLAINAGALSAIVYEADNLIRNYLKYEIPHAKKSVEVLRQVRDILGRAETLLEESWPSA